MGKTNIYLVEDDASIRTMVLYALGGNGFCATGFGSGREFYCGIQKKLPDLILLDIMLPGENGLSILQRLRQSEQTAAVPVIMLTAKASEMDKVAGLDLGADDYVAKPFGILELISRIRAVIRRTGRYEDEHEDTGLYTYEDLSICEDSHIVTLHGDEIHLTRKEFKLLWFLLENRGRVVTRESIMEHVWETGYDVETRTVDIHINTLRKKIEDNGSKIQTIRGVGYKIG